MGAGGHGAGGGAATCQGPAWPGNPACEACQNEKCCTTGANCAGDPDCVASIACAAAGTDCTSGHAGGIWNYSGLVVCVQNLCADACGMAPATCGNIQPTPASCTGEIQAACCDETKACGESDACLAFVYQCIDQKQCASQPCFNDCVAQYPDAVAPFNAMADCWSNVSCL
ncbi:Hypothetical protein A7982_04292 [Minicystis rosea]|nr:Hypothetical protein A7982_04292 [Minicystis rosea]